MAHAGKTIALLIVLYQFNVWKFHNLSYFLKRDAVNYKFSAQSFTLSSSSPRIPCHAKPSRWETNGAPTTRSEIWINIFTGITWLCSAVSVRWVVVEVGNTSALLPSMCVLYVSVQSERSKAKFINLIKCLCTLRRYRRSLRKYNLISAHSMPSIVLGSLGTYL